jgi:hypothetical protein
VDPGDPRAAETVEGWGLGEAALERLTTPQTCAVAGGLKLLRRGDREEAFDLSADPLETSPLPPDRLPPERLAALRDALAHPTVNTRWDGGAPAQEGPSADELSELEERMKLLGYM